MRGFIVISKTYDGEQALQRNIDEYKRQPVHMRAILNGIIRRVVLENPLRLEISLKNNAIASAINPKDFLDKLREAMNNEGAEEKVDYEVKMISELDNKERLEKEE